MKHGYTLRQDAYSALYVVRGGGSVHSPGSRCNLLDSADYGLSAYCYVVSVYFSRIFVCCRLVRKRDHKGRRGSNLASVESSQSVS